MAVELEIRAADKGTIVIRASFSDEDGQNIAPKTLIWSLFNGDGEIVNEKEEVTPASLAATMDFLLYGDDLAREDGSRRKFVLEATYDSTLGSDLPLNAACKFSVDDITGI